MENELVVDKGIPIPKLKSGFPPLSVWSKMEIGDSVFVPGSDSLKAQGFIKYPRTKGMRFTCRTLVENGVSGVRVWRIE